MGLERVTRVLKALQLDLSDSRVITVAGTNGKGTTCAALAQAARFLELNVGVYSSPHLIDYRERVTINNAMLSEQDHCEAFLYVEQARGDISLTYFEFSTLAALYLFAKTKPDWILLEVGLGGRLDAVNIVDPELAIITTIGIDHIDWLGDNREDIGREKAGIMRTHVDTVLGDAEAPQSVLAYADEIKSTVYRQGIEFAFRVDGDSWSWRQQELELSGLPLPLIPVQNLSTALMALKRLGVEVNSEIAVNMCQHTSVPGRMQKIASSPDVICDVAHNPQASALLAKRLANSSPRRYFFVVGMLADKDIPSTLAPLFEFDACWLPASLDVPRGADCATLASHLVGQHVEGQFSSVTDAYQRARELAYPDEVIIVFGSFFTVAALVDSVN